MRHRLRRVGCGWTKVELGPDFALEDAPGFAFGGTGRHLRTLPIGHTSHRPADQPYTTPEARYEVAGVEEVAGVLRRRRPDRNSSWSAVRHVDTCLAGLTATGRPDTTSVGTTQGSRAMGGEWHRQLVATMALRQPLNHPGQLLAQALAFERLKTTPDPSHDGGAVTDRMVDEEPSCVLAKVLRSD